MSKDPALDPNQVIIFTIAREIDFPPSMLAKMIVERHLWWQKVSTKLKPTRYLNLWPNVLSIYRQVEILQ